MDIDEIESSQIDHIVKTAKAALGCDHVVLVALTEMERKDDGALVRCAVGATSRRAHVRSALFQALLSMLEDEANKVVNKEGFNKEPFDEVIGMIEKMSLLYPPMAEIFDVLIRMVEKGLNQAIKEVRE